MIVDTHVHVVSDDQQKYPRKMDGAQIGSIEVALGKAITPGAPGEWVQDMTAETLLSLKAQTGIDKTVLVQPYSAYKYDNNYTADCAAKYPDRFTSVCILDPTQSDAPDQLTYWVKQRGMRGIRLFTTTETEGTWLDDPRTFPVWERAASLGIPICIMALFHQIPRVRTVLERFPNVTVALDHLAVPLLSDGSPYDSVQPLFELVRFPNLYLKFSSVSLYAARKGKSTPKEFFTKLVDIFGAKRLMWGSNFPATYDRSLKDQFDLATQELLFLPQEDQRWIFGETALTLWPMLR
jgi:predicted TIM-barrel fold metal-dependent hydrolase